MDAGRAAAQHGSRWALLGGIILGGLAVTAIGLPLWILGGSTPSDPTGPETPTAEPVAAQVEHVHSESDVAETASVVSSLPLPASRPVIPEPIFERVTVQRLRGGPATTQPRVAPVPTPAAPVVPETAAGRRKEVERFGGTRATEDAVDLGLAWLAKHQSPDGTWDAVDFQYQCPDDDRCPGPAIRRLTPSIRVGLTGLCLMAFVGAGHTADQGEYQHVVRAALRALVSAQRASGGFGPDDAMSGYNDALATFALAEYSANAEDTRLRGALRSAARRLVRSQQQFGGWDYLPTSDSTRNDTSITAWVLQALYACEAAGVSVNRDALVRASLHFARASETDGRVWYSDAGEGFRIRGLGTPQYRYGPAMIACAVTSEQLLGWDADSPLYRRQMSRLMADLPSGARATGKDPTQLHSEYYWYYGTVAMFQEGGERWERWNHALRDAILPLQDRPRANRPRSHTLGSWRPFARNWGKWGRLGGRVYVTAISVLTLETYYRHVPAYLKSPVLVQPADWERFIRTTERTERRIAVDCLLQLPLETGEPLLVKLLDDSAKQVAIDAAAALIILDSPVGLKLLRALAEKSHPYRKEQREQLIERAKLLLGGIYPRGKVVETWVDPSGSLALELERSYVGMPVLIRRGGQAIGTARVTRRFARSSRVLATVLTHVDENVPEPGDIILPNPPHPLAR